jgi:hypothetical protein
LSSLTIAWSLVVQRHFALLDFRCPAGKKEGE